VSADAPQAKLEPWKLACRCAVSDGVPRRSLWVALIVGTILNLINQGDRVVAGQALDVTKLALIYVVPYFVSTYGAVSFRLFAMRGETPDSR
jgi:hypothetical protein